MSPISKSKKLFLQKRKKENVRNVPKNQKQNNKIKKHLPTQDVVYIEIQKTISIKKKKRTLETFLAKSFPSNLPTQEFQKSYKKKRIKKKDQ